MRNYLIQKQQTNNFFSPAKVNLSLHVVGQQADGLHLLDSLVTFPAIGDNLSFSNSGKLNLSISGVTEENLPSNQENLILKSAKLFNKDYIRKILLTKELPISSGIGGGSANAATTIRDARSLGLDISLSDILDLGSDVLACLKSQPLRMTGVGDKLQMISIWPKTGFIVLVNPRVQLETTKVFSALKQKHNKPMPEILPDFCNFRTLVDFIIENRNDLEETAIKLEPTIYEVLTELKKDKKCLISRMSGSGATCFGLFEFAEDASEAERRLRTDFPKWWVASSKLSICKSELEPLI